MDLHQIAELGAKRDRLAAAIADAVADGQAFTLTREEVEAYRISRDTLRRAANQAATTEWLGTRQVGAAS